MEHNAPIIRRNGPNPVASHLPSMKEVVDTMAMKDWDTVPFDEGAGNKSFRNCFEGNCPEKGLSYSIHNLVGLYCRLSGGVSSKRHLNTQAEAYPAMSQRSIGEIWHSLIYFEEFTV